MGYSLWQTLRPSVLASADPNWVLVGGSDRLSAVADGSDATYIVSDPSSTLNFGYFIVGFPDLPALGPFSQVSGVQGRMRVERPGSPGDAQTQVSIGAGGLYQWVAEGLGISSPAGDPRERISPIYASRPEGGAWTVADVDKLLMYVLDLRLSPAVSPAQVMQLELRVYINNAPSATALTPTDGTEVSDTSTPVFGWAASDPEGDSIDRAEVKVFAGVGPVEAINPDYETDRLVDYSGPLVGGVTSYTPSGSLSNGDYLWAVRLADAGGWGPWTMTHFAMSVLPPAVPTLVATPDPVTNRMLLTPSGFGDGGTLAFGVGDFGDGFFGLASVDGEVVLPPAELVSIERSDDAGSTWIPVRSATNTGLPAPLSVAESSFDTYGGQWEALGPMEPGYPQRSTVEFHSAPASLAVKSTAEVVGIRTRRFIPIIPLTNWAMTARFLTRSTNLGSFSFWIEMYDQDEGFVTQVNLGSVSEFTGIWRLYAGSFIPPAEARKAKLAMYWTLADPTFGERFVDSITLTSSLLYDYEAPRVAHSLVTNPVRYRINASRYLSAGTLGTSAWSAPITPARLLTDCLTWLKNPYDPSMNAAFHHKPDWESTSAEDQGIFSAGGRSDYGVFGGTIRGEAGELDFILGDDADWAKFSALRAVPWPLLLQTVFGNTVLEQRWVRLGATPRKLVRLSTGAHNMALAQQRTVAIGFREVRMAPFI